jgi:SPP1 family predicted phage head-tail adaptor
MLSDVTLASLRSIQAAAMPDVCVIQRRTPGVRNAYGERTETWAAVATVPCRMAVASAQGSGLEQVIAAGILTGVTRYHLTVPHGTEIRGEDRIVYDGATYEVAAETADVTWQTAKRVALTRLEQA